MLKLKNVSQVYLLNTQNLLEFRTNYQSHIQVFHISFYKVQMESGHRENKDVPQF